MPRDKHFGLRRLFLCCQQTHLQDDCNWFVSTETCLACAVQAKKLPKSRDLEEALAPSSAETPSADIAPQNEELTEEHLAELAQSGWTKNEAVAREALNGLPGISQPAQPVGSLQDPSGGALPSLSPRGQVSVSQL